MSMTIERREELLEQAFADAEEALVTVKNNLNAIRHHAKMLQVEPGADTRSLPRGGRVPA